MRGKSLHCLLCEGLLGEGRGGESHVQTLKQRTELQETHLLPKVVSSLFLDLFQTSFKKAFVKKKERKPLSRMP